MNAKVRREVRDLAADWPQWRAVITDLDIEEPMLSGIGKLEPIRLWQEWPQVAESCRARKCRGVKGGCDHS